MTQEMGDPRLTIAKSRIDDLEANARGAGSLEETTRVQGHVRALRKAHASAREAAQAAGGRFEAALEELGTRLRITEHRRAAEVAGTRDRFVRSVEAELHAWDSYLEQLQKREVSTSELRSRRNDVARRLGGARIAPDDAWHEHRDRVFEALDELDRAAGTA